VIQPSTSHCGSLIISVAKKDGVYFNLVQLLNANIFLIKIEKMQLNTHKLHRDFTLETQIGKTNSMFRAAPLIFYSSYIFIFYNTTYI
jgi:hypothetical protein